MMIQVIFIYWAIGLILLVLKDTKIISIFSIDLENLAFFVKLKLQ